MAWQADVTRFQLANELRDFTLQGVHAHLERVHRVIQPAFYKIDVQNEKMESVKQLLAKKQSSATLLPLDTTVADSQAAQ